MQTTKVPSIVLYEDGIEHVLVSLRNNDRFVLTAQEVVKACRAWDKSVQFEALLGNAVKDFSPVECGGIDRIAKREETAMMRLPAVPAQWAIRPMAPDLTK